jgi:hypothetical protein
MNKKVFTIMGLVCISVGVAFCSNDTSINTNTDSLAKSVYELGMKYYERGELEQADIILRYFLLDFLAKPNTYWHTEAKIVLMDDRMYEFYVNTDYWLKYNNEIRRMDDIKLFDLESVKRKYQYYLEPNEITSLYLCVGRTNFVINVNSNLAVSISLSKRRVVTFQLIDRIKNVSHLLFQRNVFEHREINPVQSTNSSVVKGSSAIR